MLIHGVSNSNMIKGSRVQLNELGLKYFKSRLHNTERSFKYWFNRCGTVKNLSRDKQLAKIIWDNNKASSDAIPVKYLNLNYGDHIIE